MLAFCYYKQCFNKCLSIYIFEKFSHDLHRSRFAGSESCFKFWCELLFFSLQSKWANLYTSTNILWESSLFCLFKTLDIINFVNCCQFNMWKISSLSLNTWFFIEILHLFRCLLLSFQIYFDFSSSYLLTL